ncbi:polysaccharide biosynthesis/export family protein [Sagittula sp. M10.9X]|uniref:Polysaccharide biosynthesis/export family protein n=2 Tax=Sagittula salina TaxID=2820268 RepID=A0A940MVI2_9RHOB|nr:polysaccharide biosynthesis/export family protein [Sagittula salina]
MAATLSACGITYHSPSVDEKAEDVTVLELSPQVIATANSSAYMPRSLPAVFFSNAGSGGAAQGVGALPAEPYLPEETRQQLQYRPLPDIPSQPYRIGPGDELLLATKGSASTVEQLTGLLAAANSRQGYVVREDGTIAIPDVGGVDVGGLTIEEAENSLFQALVNNQIDPTFSLEISKFNSQRVAIGGAVKTSTVVAITPSGLTLGEALIAAGGVTVKDREFASIRIYRDGTLYQIPLNTYVENPGLKDKLLRGGDAIFVDTTYDLDRALAFYQARIDVIALRTSARSSAMTILQGEIALRRSALEEERSNYERRRSLGEETRDYVYLTGEVTKQSRVPLPYGRRATLADVLFGEGGYVNTTGDPSQIYVLRGADSLAPGATVVAYHLDAENIANVVMATRFEMRPNDVVFIEEQPITKWNRAFQQFFPLLVQSAQDAI